MMFRGCIIISSGAVVIGVVVGSFSQKLGPQIDQSVRPAIVVADRIESGNQQHGEYEKKTKKKTNKQTGPLRHWCSAPVFSRNFQMSSPFIPGYLFLIMHSTIFQFSWDQKREALRCQNVGSVLHQTYSAALSNKRRMKNEWP